MNIDIEKMEREAKAEVVAHVKGKPVTRGELSAAFDLVADKANWKKPIDRIMVLDDWTKALVAEAVVFFTGSVPKFRRLKGNYRYRVTAAGYYRTIGA